MDLHLHHRDETDPRHEFASAQIVKDVNNARGAVCEAMVAVPCQTALLYELLARCRGRRPYGLRYAESLLSAAEQDLIRGAWPAVPTQVEVHRASCELWAWTRYVWAEVER